MINNPKIISVAMRIIAKNIATGKPNPDNIDATPAGLKTNNFIVPVTINNRPTNIY